MGQYHFTPEQYLESIRAEVPRYDELQERAAEASSVLDAERILELGTGTGETARRVLAVHPRARLIGVDESPPMLERARALLPPDRVELRVGRLQDRLPPGPFDLVVSVLAVHHLDAVAKAELFQRIAGVVRPDGRFVLADVVVPEDPAHVVTPIEAGFDLPDSIADQLRWLREAGLRPGVVWAWKDVAVLAADAPTG